MKPALILLIAILFLIASPVVFAANHPKSKVVATAANSVPAASGAGNLITSFTGGESGKSLIN
ncbi:MAG TPA: hypothetical protein VHO84_09370, partial [Syntrophorhabdaceae bacterium]|nr:hypothetical protein [Syntrophorhabdaceae bacterium]